METAAKIRTKRNNRLRVVAWALIISLIFTNAFTLYLLVKTGYALEDALATVAAYAREEKRREQEDIVTPISVFLDYAGRDGVSMEFIQRFFNDRILIWYGDKLHSVDIDDSLKKSDFDSKHIVYNENGIRGYAPEKGKDISLFGIDVSSYQGNIDWQKVKEQDVDYAIIRLGYRGYGTGEVLLDSKYKQNMNGAAEADIPTGVYFYSQAISVEEAIEEADTVIKNLEGYDISYPVVFDMEEVNDIPENVRTSSLTAKQRTDITIAFCERIKDAGYTPMIYGNISWMIMNLEIERLEDYDKWFAQYYKQPFFPYEFSMWQYTARGTLEGIEGTVDFNMGFKDYAENK